MTDKEVGELWREKTRHSTDCVFTNKIDALIRKLVEERARLDHLEDWIDTLEDDIHESDVRTHTCIRGQYLHKIDKLNIANALEELGISEEEFNAT